MMTDQGKEFFNQVNAELMKVFGIEHRMTTAYHPQANGLDEHDFGECPVEVCSSE